MKTYNIILTNLSILFSKNIESQNIYAYDINCHKGKVNGIMTNEAGVKYFINELLDSQMKIDEICCVGTKEVQDKIDNLSYSTYDFFKQQIKQYCNENNIDVPKIHMQFSIESSSPQSNELVNLSVEIVNYILSLHESNLDKKIQLYIECNGGFREFILIVVALLRTLRNTNISIKRIVGVNFNFNQEINQIVDKTIAYQVYDLYSGVDEFINYGRANKINEYFKNSDIKLTQEMQCVIMAISNMSDAFSLCWPKCILLCTNELRKAIDNYQKNSTSKLFDYLVHTISLSYEKIFMFMKQNNYLYDYKVIREMITFCNNHNLIQQSLTIYSECMPVVFFDYDIMKLNVYDQELIKHFYDYISSNKKKGKMSYNIKNLNHKDKYKFIQQYMLVTNSEKSGLIDLYNKEKRTRLNTWSYEDKIYALEMLLEDRYVYSSFNINSIKEIMKDYLDIKSLRNKSNHANEENIKGVNIDKNNRVYSINQIIRKSLSKVDELIG